MPNDDNNFEDDRRKESRNGDDDRRLQLRPTAKASKKGLFFAIGLFLLLIAVILTINNY
ncbi:MAG: hypothetical protein HON90_10015 [Halobacteriovoraceae bacterium]|jgi:hypothetical protein|nr:hypothetical protein [Halobacteriovoraceae bacterium]